MLDPTMTYSCGIFKSPETTLEEVPSPSTTGSSIILRSNPIIICSRSGVVGVDSPIVWRTHARLTATTISEQQYEYALERIRKNGWDDRIKVVKQDYRNLSGQFDRVVSIEMIEAVGHEYLPGLLQDLRAARSRRGCLDSGNHHAGSPL